MSHYTPTPVPDDYLMHGYGLHGPVVDGMLIARQLIVRYIPDHTQYEGEYVDDSHRSEVSSHNDYKDEVLSILDQRIDQMKTRWGRCRV